MVAVTEGVTFDNVRGALCAIYFLEDDMTEAAWNAALEYVVPMQHNIESPLNAKSGDTFIQYWIEDDDRITQDKIAHGYDRDVAEETGNLEPALTSTCLKCARINIRFLGAQAEAWAKMFHHLTKRNIVATMFQEYCNANYLEYIGSIRPINVDYFGAQNTTVGFDIDISLQYNEVIRLPANRLKLMSIASGSIE